jgi:hypothetical protein
VDETVSAQLEELQQRKTKELQARFREVFGIRAPPANRTHLLRGLAWQLQAQRDGTHSNRLLLRAFSLTGLAYPHLPRPRDVPPSAAEPQPAVGRDPRLPAAGTTLERRYQGKLVTVTVLDDCFDYNGKAYRSLSAIAFEVTGTRWNGFHFFGLQRVAA